MKKRERCAKNLKFTQVEVNTLNFGVIKPKFTVVNNILSIPVLNMEVDLDMAIWNDIRSAKAQNAINDERHQAKLGTLRGRSITIYEAVDAPRILLKYTVETVRGCRYLVGGLAKIHEGGQTMGYAAPECLYAAGSVTW